MYISICSGFVLYCSVTFLGAVGGQNCLSQCTVIEDKRTNIRVFFPAQYKDIFSHQTRCNVAM